MDGVLGGVPWVRLAGIRTMAGGIEVKVLLDSRLFDGEGGGPRMCFFPYFSTSFGLFCFLLKKISSNLLVLFLFVHFVVKTFIMNLVTISVVSAMTLITSTGLVVGGVVGSMTLYGVVDRGIGVRQVWRGVVYELGWEMDRRAKEGDGRRRGDILKGGTGDGRHMGFIRE